MSSESVSFADVYFNKKSSSSLSKLLEFLDKINEKTENLELMLKEQGILSQVKRENFKIVSHKTINKRNKPENIMTSQI